MVRSRLSVLDAFFREHWIGIILFALFTGVVGNFVYDWVKPKDQPTTAAPEVRADPQLSAQAIRASASSLRAIAANHMRSPPPAKWQEAEQLYMTGTERYAHADFQGAYANFDAAYRIYSDLYAQAQFEGH
jgi:hypothetical protein